MGKRRPFHRTDRLSSQIKEVLALAIMMESHEDLLRAAVITDVDVTNDVSLARVYWHAMPGAAEGDPAAIQAAFNRAAGFLRKKVGEAISARITPELRFFHDDALDRGRRIEDILRTIPKPPPEVAAIAPALERVGGDAADADEADTDRDA